MAGLSAGIVAKWHGAVSAFDSGRLAEAREKFSEVQGYSAKILFNMSTVDLLLGDYAVAHKQLTECLTRDRHLAVAYFQLGVVECYLGRLTESAENFQKAQDQLRGEDLIDYKQLGMPVKLTREQIQHSVNAVQRSTRMSSAQISGKDLMMLPLKQCIFRPPKSAVNSLEKRQFLQEAKIVSSVPEIRTPAPVKAVLPVGKSSSTPTSPALGRRQHLAVTTSGHPGATTPPPTRAPPRLPPSSVTAALGCAIPASVNKSDSELDCQHPNQKLQNRANLVNDFTGGKSGDRQEWSKGSNSGRSIPFVVPHGKTAGFVKGTDGGGQKLPPPVRPPPAVPVSGADGKKWKPAVPPLPKKP